MTQTVAFAPINAKSLQNTSSFSWNHLFGRCFSHFNCHCDLAGLFQTRVLIYLFRFSFLLISRVRRMRFFCINLFLFYVIATYTLYLSPVSFPVGVSFSVNSGIIYHQNNKYAFCQVFYFVQWSYLMFPNLGEKILHGTADLFIYNVW